MKRYLLMFALMLVSIVSTAQTWKCPEFEKDLQKYSTICEQYKPHGNKTWAKQLAKQFPIAPDNTIKYQYVVKSDSTFNVEDINSSLIDWYKGHFQKCNPVTPNASERLSAIATLSNVGRYVGYMNVTVINARIEVTIEIKENRVRITAIVLNYLSANSWDGNENVAPGSCFPVNPDGGQKDSHAMAFINCHNNALGYVKSIIEHLNRNSNTILNGEDEW